MKHRIVCIHCFANGNGRHSRLLADALVNALGQPLFTWGERTAMPDARDRYFEASRKADRGGVRPLIAFARSCSRTAIALPRAFWRPRDCPPSGPPVHTSAPTA
ncbi:MAG: Fic family protein [Flavobacteriales bacterium]|nr:Fic family protein [Flavobacteriales bacterium]MBK7754416.1 Fic family protein [Flavobacteriales bacterium]